MGCLSDLVQQRDAWTLIACNGRAKLVYLSQLWKATHISCREHILYSRPESKPIQQVGMDGIPYNSSENSFFLVLVIVIIIIIMTTTASNCIRHLVVVIWQMRVSEWVMLILVWGGGGGGGQNEEEELLEMGSLTLGSLVILVSSQGSPFQSLMRWDQCSLK